MGNSNPVITQMKEPQRKWTFLCKERSSQILTNVKTKPSGVTDSLLYESCKQGILLNGAGTRAVQVDTGKNFFTRRTDPRADPERVGPDIPVIPPPFPCDSTKCLAFKYTVFVKQTCSSWQLMNNENRDLLKFIGNAVQIHE